MVWLSSGLCACSTNALPTVPARAPTPAQTSKPPDGSAGAAKVSDETPVQTGTWLQQLRSAVPDGLVPQREVWYSVLLQGSKVGHAQLRCFRIEGRDGEVLRWEMEQQLSILRAGQRLEQRIVLQSLERPDGTVLALRWWMRDATSESEMLAEPRDGTLQLVLRTADSSSMQILPWQPEIRGFFADEQLLMAAPVQPGQRRHTKMFMPIANLIGELVLTVGQWESTDTPLGTQQLVKVEGEFRHPQLTTKTVYWCEADGQIQKYTLPEAKLTVVRTPRELALAANQDVDLFTIFQVPVTNPIDNPHSRRVAVYRARLRNQGNPERFFVHDTSQRVRLLDPNTVEITVLRVTATEPAELPESPQPTPQDLLPNAYVQSDHPTILALAERVAPATVDAWTWAVECESFVHQYIKLKSLDTAFASALEVANSQAGDCTEHAVLMAALCRARGLPARVATGLVATGSSYGFHAWNEVWINNRWVPLDATLAAGGVGVGHIKMAVSDLAGVTPFSVVAPVLELASSLELEVISFE